MNPVLNSKSPEPCDWVVLVVDDTPDNLSIAETVLSFSGAKVHTARNGAEGLAVVVADFKVDVPAGADGGFGIIVGQGR